MHQRPATGLIYGGTQVSTCDPSAQTGWIAINPGAVPNNWRTLSFSFAPRMFAVDRFVFDVDTDGTTTGPQSGGDMKGLMVTIRLADDSVHSGVLVADPHNSERSRWSWVW